MTTNDSVNPAHERTKWSLRRMAQRAERLERERDEARARAVAAESALAAVGSDLKTLAFDMHRGWKHVRDGADAAVLIDKFLDSHATLATPTTPDAPPCTCVVGVCCEDDEDGCCESPHCPATPTTPEETPVLDGPSFGDYWPTPETQPQGTERVEWNIREPDGRMVRTGCWEDDYREFAEQNLQFVDGGVLVRRTVTEFAPIVGEWEPVEVAPCDLLAELVQAFADMVAAAAAWSDPKRVE